jgi:hypothetical protein
MGQGKLAVCQNHTGTLGKPRSTIQTTRISNRIENEQAFRCRKKRRRSHDGTNDDDDDDGTNDADDAEKVNYFKLTSTCQVFIGYGSTVEDLYGAPTGCFSRGPQSCQMLESFEF